MTAEDEEKVHLSKTTNTRRKTTKTTPPNILATPPTSPSRGGGTSSSASNKHHNKRHSTSSSRKGRTSSSKVQLADGDNRESSNSRRSSRRTASIELSPTKSSPSSSKRSSRKINLQLADGDANHHQKSPHKPSSSSRRSSSRRSSSRRHNKTTSRHHNDNTHNEDTSNSSSEHDAPGAFPVDSLNPQSANSTTTHTITSHDSSDVMIAAEISPDREDEVRQAYQRGAEDMRNALQQNDQLRLRVRQLEEQNNNTNGGSDNVIVAVAREDDEDDKKKFSKATICGCFVFGILALAGAIVGSIYGIRQSDPPPASKDPTIFLIGPPTLQDCESVVNETGIVDPDFVQSTMLYLDMAVLRESGSQEMSQSELDNLQQRILLYILTVLLGCEEQAIQTLEEEIFGGIEQGSTRWLVQEENVVNDGTIAADDLYATNNTTDIFQEYVVGNALIWDMRVWPSNQVCLEYYPDTEDYYCTQVRMVLEVTLRTKIQEDDLAWAVLEEFQREPLESRLKVDQMENNPYELIEVVILDILPEDYIFEPSIVANTTMSPVPTVAPSPPIVANFSSAPSTSPSISPSISLGPGGNGNGNGGDNPAVTTPEPTTPNPSLSPTDVPSMPPSPPPTVLPSQSPSQRPTVSPTRNPTRNPTPGPTPNPTTPPPTRAPSPQPTPSPTARPTPFPSPPPSASPSVCPTPSCSGTLTCTSFTDTMTIHPCGSCSLDQDCSYAGSMTIGFNSCNGKEECNAGYGNVIGDHSCNGNDATWDGVSSTHACAHLHSVQIGDDSCNCAECCACFDYGVIKGNNVCNTPGECCTVFGGTKLVGTGSCVDAPGSRTYSCLGSKGTIGMNSCNGMEACKNKRDVVGDGSCNGVLSCGYHTGNVGDGSCLGFKACQGNWDAFIGDGSCNGTDACKQVNNASIGDGSCNCQACCACLPDGVIVPDGSCNVRAASPGAIDFVSGVGGTACCYYSTLPP